MMSRLADTIELILRPWAPIPLAPRGKPALGRKYVLMLLPLHL